MIDVGTLSITQEHIDKVTKALKSGRLSYGPMTTQFEDKFSRIHGDKYGVFTNSGTSSLQAAIHALKILGRWKDGDEVIIPSVTFVATYNVVIHNNLTPVIVDVDKNMTINPELIEKAITKRTRAIMPVHLLGKAADMNEIIEIAEKHNLKIIEDSCETMFVRDVGRGDVSCFSFYIAHLLVTGVGGMACTNDPELAELIRSLIFHGRDNKYLKIDDDDKYNPEVIKARFRFNYPGYSSRGTEMEAALGLVELENYGEMVAKRQENARYLSEKLGNHHPESYLEDHAFMMFPFFHLKRNELMLHLEKKGITTRTIMPLINQPYIKVNSRDYPEALRINRYGLLLGCHQDLKKKDLDLIISSIEEFNNDRP